MTRPIEITQDCDQFIDVTMNTDIQTATEIEFVVDAPTKISKSLSGGEISSVTSTGFRVAIDAADTTNTKPGDYLYQARATIGGKRYNIRFTPNRLRIKDSAFVDSTVNGDYCGC